MAARTAMAFRAVRPIYCLTQTAAQTATARPLHPYRRRRPTPGLLGFRMPTGIVHMNRPLTPYRDSAGSAAIYRIWAGAIVPALFLFAEVLAIKNGLDVRWMWLRLSRGGLRRLLRRYCPRWAYVRTLECASRKVWL